MPTLLVPASITDPIVAFGVGVGGHLGLTGVSLLIVLTAIHLLAGWWRGGGGERSGAEAQSA